MNVRESRNFARCRARAFAIGMACLVGVGAEVAPARAEVSEVRIVRQFGIHYLPLVIMEHEQLIEKAAAAALQWSARAQKCRGRVRRADNRSPGRP